MGDPRGIPEVARSGVGPEVATLPPEVPEQPDEEGLGRGRDLRRGATRNAHMRLGVGANLSRKPNRHRRVGVGTDADSFLDRLRFECNQHVRHRQGSTLVPQTGIPKDSTYLSGCCSPVAVDELH